MKKVTKKSCLEVVELNNISNEKFYGVQYPSNKAFIMRERIGGFYYYLVPADKFVLNCYDLPFGPSLMGVIEYLLDDAVPVFEFNTSKELFAWLAKD